MALSQKQIRAAELLARGYSQEEAGKAVGASRRSVSRWLQSPEFKQLSYGLIGRSQPPSQSPQPPPQCPPEERPQSSGLTPQDLVPNALQAVRDVLIDPDSRSADRLKAATLVGQWAGLEASKSKMAELEGLKILIEAGWIPDEVLRVVEQQNIEMSEKIADAFYGCFRQGRSENESVKKPNPPPWPRDPWV